MRAGLVGTLANYRPQELKGVRFGSIDVIFTGDINYPTESQSIKVLNHSLCAFLIDTLSKLRDPIITMACWIDVAAKDVILLEILSVDSGRELIVAGREHAADS